MANGFFYGFDSRAAARSAAPEIFDGAGEDAALKADFVLGAISWVTPPVMGPVDPVTRSAAVLTPGEPVPAFTVLSPTELSGLEAHRIAEHAPAAFA